VVEEAIPWAEERLTPKTTFELERDGPAIVVRLLNGAVLVDMGSKLWEVRHEGVRIQIAESILKDLKIIAEQVRKTHLAPCGLKTPLSVESALYAMDQAQIAIKVKAYLEPSILRVVYIRGSSGGCGFYRVIQPVRYLRALSESPVRVGEASFGILSCDFFCKFDMVVAPRVTNIAIITMLKDAQRVGVLVVYETDDALDSMPPWNPCRSMSTPEQRQQRHILQKISDGIIESTEELRDQLKCPEKTYVAHNGISPDLWPLKDESEATGNRKLRIMWASGNTHSGDLDLVIPAIEELRRRYTWVFVGYTPDKFTDPGWQGETVVRRLSPRYAGWIVPVTGCQSAFDWPRLLADQKCDLALAPLAPHPFNEAKSELKVLEAWALGLPVIASDIAPYRRAIGNSGAGLLVPNDPKAWKEAIYKVAEDPELRRNMAIEGRKRLEPYLMGNLVKEHELALLKIARGRISRVEANAAIEERLKVLGEGKVPCQDAK